MSHIPHLERRNDKTVLIVHDRPLILLAGEVHNSNSSSLEYMESVWEKAEALGMNALLLPVAWETVEPREGQFDFALVDGLIAQARQRDKHLVLLWFGSWKNAECMYAPAWVKTDLARFRRAQIVKGKNKAPRKEMYGIPYTSLSYLCEETRDADARAFARLMAHLREFDGKENTVVAVQVENETGLLGAAREVSAGAACCSSRSALPIAMPRPGWPMRWDTIMRCAMLPSASRIWGCPSMRCRGTCSGWM